MFSNLDIDFHPEAIISVLDIMQADSGLGSVCGRIAPMGKGMVYYYQLWEYGTGHWLLKSTEDILGTVLFGKVFMRKTLGPP